MEKKKSSHFVKMLKPQSLRNYQYKVYMTETS